MPNALSFMVLMLFANASSLATGITLTQSGGGLWTGGPSGWCAYF
jgi:hypothetical protein